MKILHVTKKYPSALGGDAVVVSNLQKQQVAAGHNVAIVTSNCDEIKNGKHIYKIGLRDTAAKLDTITFKRLISLLILFFRMFGIIRTERPDIIHTHSVDMAFFVSFAARWHGVPIVHTFHIVTFYDAEQSALRRKSELWLAKNAKPRLVTAPNTYDVKRLNAAGLTQTRLLPNGVDVLAWEPRGYTERNHIFTFLAVGRLESQKGYEYLVKAAALLATAPTSFHVLIVGEGSQKTALQELVRTLRLQGVVTLIGRKRQEEIRTLLAEANAAVLPSLYETTPLTLLEAWSATTPVIATRVGILRDVQDDFNAAYVVPPKNEELLMTAMSSAMSDHARRLRIAANGHEEAKKYAWPIVTKEAEALYETAL